MGDYPLSCVVRPEIHPRFSIADHTTVAVKWGLFLPVAALNSPYFTATYLGDELEGAEEDGVGGGFAELELVTGVELGGTAGLYLNTHARGPVYHHRAVG